ncbi:MAG: hypothetical protein J5747_00565 [Spirochaetaceae bacterium]|nr:hypothetical protein [Spirochaetaceae bacterium]
MKYTAKLKESQFAGGVKLNPNGGTVSDAEAIAIASDPWGKKLIDSGKLTFEKAVEIPTKPKLGMTVSGSIKGTASAKSEIKK